MNHLLQELIQTESFESASIFSSANVNLPARFFFFSNIIFHNRNTSFGTDVSEHKLKKSERKSINSRQFLFKTNT